MGSFVKHSNISPYVGAQPFYILQDGVVSPGIEPGYIVFPSHKNNVNNLVKGVVLFV